MSSDPPLTTGEAARYCHVSQATIINWIKDDKLKAYSTPGGHYRIPRPDLIAFLRTYQMPVDRALRESIQPRLLCLSRNPRIRSVARTLNEKNGCDVALADSDYEASADIARSEPDAVVVDTRTSTDPMGFCQWVRDHSDDVALVIVGTPEGAVPARSSGAGTYVCSDDLSDLEATLRMLLR